MRLGINRLYVQMLRILTKTRYNYHLANAIIGLLPYKLLHNQLTSFVERG